MEECARSAPLGLGIERRTEQEDLAVDHDVTAGSMGGQIDFPAGRQHGAVGDGVELLRQHLLW